MEVTLRVTDNYEPDQYLLVEFTDEIDDIFEKARLNSEELPKLCIKAQSLDEEPVFCTPDKTFSIKKKEYTDSMCLFVPQPVKKHEGSKMDIDEDFNIVSVESNNNTDFSRKSELLHKREEILMKRPEFILEMVEKRKFVVELIQQPPELEVLNKLLKPTTYTGPENEEHIKKKYKLYTLDELDGIIKASVGEILCTFERKYALEIDGYWRYVDLEYLLQLYEAINLQAGIYLGNFEVIKLSEISKIISDYGFPDFLIRHCLSMLSESKCENELDPIFILSPSKVSRFVAIVLLDTHNKNNLLLNDFMKEWRLKVPSKFEIVIKQDEQGLEYILYQPVDELSSIPKERFKQLFTIKPRWRADQLEQFLKDIADTKKKIYDYIFKYSRYLTNNGHVVKENDKVYFVAKRGELKEKELFIEELETEIEEVKEWCEANLDAIKLQEN
ncbi:1051_t:CDS:2 [Entrophospora sp. SA101]|nr:1051_t:CDS:2 [Entrophospora sp. SA101]